MKKKYAIGDYVLVNGRLPAIISEFYDENCAPMSEPWYEVKFAEINIYTGCIGHGGHPEGNLLPSTKEKFDMVRKSTAKQRLAKLTVEIENLRSEYGL